MMAGAETKADVRHNENLCCRHFQKKQPSKLIRERTETQQRAEGLETSSIHDSETLDFKLLSGQHAREHLPLEATLSGGFSGAKDPHEGVTELHDPRYLALVFQGYMGHMHKTETIADRWTKFKEWQSIVSWKKWGYARGRHAGA
jgi:hypothetical protein